MGSLFEKALLPVIMKHLNTSTKKKEPVLSREIREKINMI